jgi:hypothetical protein
VSCDFCLCDSFNTVGSFVRVMIENSFAKIL